MPLFVNVIRRRGSQGPSFELREARSLTQRREQCMARRDSWSSSGQEVAQMRRPAAWALVLVLALGMGFVIGRWSSGQGSATKVTVPGVIAFGHSKAVSVLHAAGFAVDVGQVVVPSKVYPAGYVLTEWPGGGISAGKGSTVAITVACPPWQGQAPPPPNFC